MRPSIKPPELVTCRCGTTFMQTDSQAAHYIRQCRSCLNAAHMRFKHANGTKPAVRFSPAHFWSRVDKTGECWLWTGHRNNSGYGVTSVDSIRSYAHRVAYEIEKGAIPPGLDVMHSCDNPPCCNPAHLSVGTAKDNAADMVRKGRGRNGATP